MTSTLIHRVILGYLNPNGSSNDSSSLDEWFDNSKATDTSGRPLTVYHGTPTGGFSEFDEERRGSKGGHSHGGWSFTTDKNMAERYALGFGDSSVTIGEAFRIANKALKKLENIPEAKNAALEHWNLSEGDDLYEFRHENFDKEDINEWASDINSLARKIKAYAPSQSSELTRAATLMNSGIASNPMVY